MLWFLYPRPYTSPEVIAASRWPITGSNRCFCYVDRLASVSGRLTTAVATDTVPAMRSLDRRWWVAIGVVVVAVVAFVLSETVFSRPSEECRPVLDMLEFNSAQGRVDRVEIRRQRDPAVPSVAEDAAYQQWADGLAQRAERGDRPQPGRARPCRWPIWPPSSSPSSLRCAPRRKRELLAPRLRRWCTRCRPSISASPRDSTSWRRPAIRSGGR